MGFRRFTRPGDPSSGCVCFRPFSCGLWSECGHPMDTPKPRATPQVAITTASRRCSRDIGQRRRIATRREAVSSRTACATCESAGIPRYAGIPKRSVDQMQPVSTSSVVPLAPYWLPAILHVALGLSMPLRPLGVSRRLAPSPCSCGPGVARVWPKATSSRSFWLGHAIRPSSWPMRLRLVSWPMVNACACTSGPMQTGCVFGGEQRG